MRRQSRLIMKRRVSARVLSLSWADSQKEA